MPEKSNPFQEIEQLFDDFIRMDAPLTSDPAVDVVDADDELVVFVDLPGRDADSIEVTLAENRTLTVSADRREPDIEGRYVQQERASEPVSRSVDLPAGVDEAETEASYDRGVLRIELPKLTGDGEGTDIPVN
jgi:HSP20 family protein